MDVLNVIISLISGIVGGNVAGAAMPEKNMGGAANSILGLVGGGIGDYILRAVGVLASTAMTGGTTAAAQATGAATGTEFDIASLLANIGVSGVSGGVLTAIVALIKDALQKR